MILLIVPIYSLLLSFFIGIITTTHLSIEIYKGTKLFFAITLGILLSTIFNFLISLLIPFPTSIIIGQSVLTLFVIGYIIKFPSHLLQEIQDSLLSLLSNKTLLLLIIIFGFLLWTLFTSHIIPSLNGDLYTGESTYGDLPFHLSTIAQIAYGHHFPPENPMYQGISLVYPYLINFFSAILVVEGWSLQYSILIPGILLSLSLAALLYEFAFYITKKTMASTLTVLFYFLNGGIGFYYFLKDYSFNLTRIISALGDPTNLKEYSHLFDQNIQWASFLTRMIVPERSILFGISAGIILLRLLFFRPHPEKIPLFELFIASLLCAMMPLLHTHTVIVFALIFPILLLSKIRKSNWRDYLYTYTIFIIMTALLSLTNITTFFHQLSSSPHFMQFHLGWMKLPNESLIWFWIKNSYLYIPFSLIALLWFKKTTTATKVLQICGLLLLLITNLILFSPYNWDNIKFLLWAGLFFSLASAEVITALLEKRRLWLIVLCTFITITMIASSTISFIREINVHYQLFSKDAVAVGAEVLTNTPPDAIFLTYKVHNSPISNLAGRSILMGYPGLLWTHGIDYTDRSNDIDQIFSGTPEALSLIQKYHINYIVIEKNDPSDILINRAFLSHFPLFFRNDNYSIYKVS